MNEVKRLSLDMQYPFQYMEDENGNLVYYKDYAALQEQITNTLKSAGIEADTVQAGVMELVSKLAELEKQEPVACKKRLVNHRSGVEHSWTYHGEVDKASQGDVFRVEVVPLFARPAPAIDLNAVRAEGVELKAQRDALAANEGYKQAFYEMAEILGIGACPDSPKNVFELVIKPKLEALMKERGKLASENLTLANLITSWPQERCPVTGAVTDVQPDDIFPETNTYINCVRAEGADAAAFKIRKAIPAFKDIHCGAVKECADIAEMVAVQFMTGNAGKDGSHE